MRGRSTPHFFTRCFVYSGFMAAIQSIRLHAFRNYRDSAFNDLNAGLVILTGQNGVGKTNLLEAISLLTPGRGLRGSKMAELRNKAAPEGVQWSVAASVDSPVGVVKIGTGMRADAQTERRVARVNGVDLKAQADLAEYLSCVWLTPQMDGLFINAASERRRFFDRLVFAFDATHAGRVTRYESVLSQRARLLKIQREEKIQADRTWLSSLEATMAETGVAIAAARLQTLDSLSGHLEGILKGTGFPASQITLTSGIEVALRQRPALEIEDMMRARLEASRVADSENGGASVGPHRTDLQVSYAEKGMHAAQCSTGEQKALLTGLILAHAVRTHDVRDAAPILLLDEIAAHLDPGRRAALFGILGALGAQVFVTGTEASAFSDFSRAQFLNITAVADERLQASA